MTRLDFAACACFQINASPLYDPSKLKQGVRYVFNLDGTLVTECSQLIDGQSYVCSSTPNYKPLDYEYQDTRDWVRSTRLDSPRNGGPVEERSSRRGSGVGKSSFS